MFVDGVPPANTAGGGGGGCGGFFDFFGKNEGTPFLFLLPLDLKSSIEVVEEAFELDKFDKFSEFFVELPFWFFIFIASFCFFRCFGNDVI